MNRFNKWNPLKKNRKKMTEQDLISYKEHFTGQTFQWIKTSRIELLGKVVTCRDVDFVGGRIMAIFNDGSQCPAEQVSNNLLMIHGEMQPLSQIEVESISGHSTQPVTKKSEPITTSTPIQPTNKVNKTVDTPKLNPFEIFNSNTTDLAIKIKIKLPDKKLLKLMYNNAENKEQFLTQLSDYVYSQINNNVVKESLKKTLDEKPALNKQKPNSGSDIKLTEIEDE